MITVVLAIKNRPIKETSNCLYSLISQNCNIILVDYGSRKANLSWERLFCRTNNIKLIEVENNTLIFNKSRALNIGIIEATTDYVMFGDIDLIYQPNFIHEAEKVVNKNRLVTCRRYNQNKDGTVQKDSVRAYGGCIILSREWLMSIHGFDEKYTFWGGEDDDIITRAIACNMDVYTLPIAVTSCLHQYHKESVKITLKANREYYKLKKPIVRNTEKWGQL